jgi:predicted acetyltransferase
MTVDVRTVTEAEFPAWVAAMRAGFLGHAAEGEAEVRRVSAHLDRTWGAFDGDRVVGTLRSWPCEITLPGGAAVPVAALTNVTVSATHRRRGLLTRMMAPDLGLAKEQGEVAGILIAAEYPIYGRYGYGPATQKVDLAVDANAARFGERPPGSVELTDLAALRKVGPALYEDVRAHQPGAITRTERWWDITCELVAYPGEEPFKGYVAIGRDAAGEPDGYVRYKVEGRWEDGRPASSMEVVELLACTPDAYARLWRYCCEVDWVATVKAPDRCHEEALPWLLADARVITRTEQWDLLWLRPLDVASLLSSRRYLTDGRVVVEVVDPAGLAGGRFALEGGPDGASCTTTSASPGLTLGVGELGAVSLGDGSLRSLAMAGRVDVHDPASLATADAMFRGEVAPWCSTWF